jgi:hypothetical protein
MFAMNGGADLWEAPTFMGFLWWMAFGYSYSEEGS